MQGDAAILVLSAVRPLLIGSPTWSEKDAVALRGAATKLLARNGDAATMLGNDANRLVAGIPLVPYLPTQGGPFGPSWAGHPFASPAMAVRYKPREPDVTRELEALMGPRAGRRGQQRALSFLRIVADLTKQDRLGEALRGAQAISVKAEQQVGVVLPRRGNERGDGEVGSSSGRSGSPPRIDLLFEWPVGSTGQRAVVVVEAKLGATVSTDQLLPYNQEAKRRARGGPITRVLLTVRPDPAEARNRLWLPVRWFALMRRWEASLAEAGDNDPSFAITRAHIWSFLFQNRGLAV